MNDFIKNFLEREREELEKHKVRIGFSVVIAVAAIIFSVIDFDSGKEVILTESPQVEEKISAPAKVEKISEVKQVSDDNITPVIGANAENIFVKNPFQTPEVAEVETAPEVEEEISEPEKNSPPVVIVQQTAPPQKNSTPVQEEKFILSGTAIGDKQRTALVQHYKGKNFSGTIILQVGDSLKGKKVVDITEDAVTLEGGEKIFVY